MIFDTITNIESCHVAIPHLTLYSHIPTAAMALLLGFFVFLKTRKQNSIVGKILLFNAVVFSIWSCLDLYLWLGVDSRLIMFSWSVVNLCEMLSSSSAVYFSYVFLEKRDAPLFYKVFFGLLFLPFVALIPTSFNLTGFDSVNCEAAQGPLMYYFYFLEVFTFVWLFVYLLRKIIAAKSRERKIVVLFAVGVILFLASFSGANIIGSLTENWEILQYGLFGMPVFMALLAYLIIRYKVLSIKLFVAHALVLAMVILIGSQFFFIQNKTNQILTAITLCLVAFFGSWLARSIRKEISQRERLEKLTQELKVANLRLQELDNQKTEFLSIASHQLRTPLSILKGYIELIKDGGYGRPTKGIVNTLDDMDKNNEHLINMVDEFLNISRIEQGRTKYNFQDEDIGALIKEITGSMALKASDKGIKVLERVSAGLPSVKIDKEKIHHVVFNFVDNAIKYSDGGAVTVKAKESDGGVEVNVVDQGMGFGKVDQANFFQKFYRGENVKNVNVTGTGLGLYVCRKFIEAHGGKVWARSPGLKKGSEFGFWIPLTPPVETGKSSGGAVARQSLY